MKLLAATNRYYFISITLFFLFAGVILFYMIDYHLKDELNEQLIAESEQVKETLKNIDSLDSTSFILNLNVTASKINYNKIVESKLYDTMIYDRVDKEIVPYRVIQFSVKTKNANYLISIKKSEIEANDVAYSILIGLIVVFGLFCIMLFIFNYYFSKKLWSPFLKTINAIKSLDFSLNNNVFKGNPSYIQEFNDLNNSLEQMIDRIKSDYNRMKEFTENAAHELQTPLAIIRSKLESLLQSSHLIRDEAILINQALENSIRLSKLNQTLLLLTKIENNQYDEKKEIIFADLISKFLDLHSEKISKKNLRIEIKKDEEFVLNIHPMLAELLASNLVSNSINHNTPNGFIKIQVKSDKFEIVNTGEAPEVPCEVLFTRFKKGTQTSEHLGLGLALIKEIAEKNKLQVHYQFENNTHILKIAKH